MWVKICIGLNVSKNCPKFVMFKNVQSSNTFDHHRPKS